MEKLIYKAGTAVATAALILGSVSPFALADTTVEISGNGTNSTNTANVAVENLTVVEQSNTANIQNDVNVSANTGNNEANDNTGGDVSIGTGNAEADVNVSNEANSNVAEVNGCCPGDVTATISGNGSDTSNTINLDVCGYDSEKCGTFVSQSNEANILNTVHVDLDTGNNQANDNTGGDVSIDTGNAQAGSGVTISNTANANVAQVGGGSGGTVWVEISGNGENSTNEANVSLEHLVVVAQSNEANIWNDVHIDANTGNNEANDNTGGDVSIGTGNAEAEVDISNTANFNWADVDACGCLLGLTVKIKNNGSDSENTAYVWLLSALFVGQSNDFDCKSEVDPCADVHIDSDTGNNEANDNTQDGEPSIDTGNAGADVTVENEANSNVVGDVDLDDLDLGLPDSFFDVFGDVSGLLVLLLALFS